MPASRTGTNRGSELIHVPLFFFVVCGTQSTQSPGPDARRRGLCVDESCCDQGPACTSLLKQLPFLAALFPQEARTPCLIRVKSMNFGFERTRVRQELRDRDVAVLGLFLFH